MMSENIHISKKKIFLASSADLKEEREKFEAFVNRKNNQWVDKGIYFELVIWEVFLSSISKTRKQEDYNKAIQHCDIFVMLFFDNVGRFSLEEFDAAFEQFKTTGSPLIYTYFKDTGVRGDVENKRKMNSLWKFQTRLKKIGHFYFKYENVDQLQSDFNIQLDKLILDGFPPKLSDYDRFNIELERHKRNQKKLTDEPLEDIYYSDLDESTVSDLVGKERAIQHLNKSRAINENLTRKLELLGLIVQDTKIPKGVYLSLGIDAKISGFSNIAGNSKFALFNDEVAALYILDDLRGNLLSQYNSAISNLINRLQLVRDTTLDKDDLEIPRSVFRELIANAFIHTDYEHKVHTTNIKIELFTDRLVVTNPGYFPKPIDPNKPETIHTSITLNPYIAKIFFLYGIVETIGKGIIRIRETLTSQGFDPPHYEWGDGVVKVTVFKKKLKRPVAKEETFARSKKFPKELTLNIPKVDPGSLIGRDRNIEELHKVLNSDRKTVIVNGLGGIGKTTLAAAYLTKYYDSYSHVAWINQSSMNLANDFSNTPGLTDNLGIEELGKKPDQIFNAIISELRSMPDKPNLLIIDNAEHGLLKYQDILPGPPNWHLLMTSREELHGFYVHELDFLSEKQAIDLFKKHYTRAKLDDDDIKELLSAVDYHTLSIEILAKTAQVQRYELSVLKDAIGRNLRSNVQVPHSKLNKIDNIGTYLRSVFSLSNLNENELRLLKQFICLPGEFHPYDLLRELIVDEKDQFSEIFAEVLATLSQKGWLLHNRESDSFKMHRILAEVIKREQPLDVSDIQNLARVLANKLSIDSDKDNPVSTFVWIPYGKALINNFFDEIPNDLLLFASNLALRFRDLGDYMDAKELMQKVLSSAVKIYASDAPELALYYSNFALILVDLGEYASAKELLEKAVRSDEHNFGPDHPTTATNYSNLALVFRDIGDYQGAKRLLEKAITSTEKRLGSDHPETLSKYSNLALVLKSLGDYQGAKALLERVVKSDEINLGLDHPATSTSYSNLAMVFLNLKNYQEAKALLEKSLKSDERNFGINHPRVAIRYSNLAMVLKDVGDYEEALLFLKKAIAIFNQNLPQEHPYIQTVKSNLQSILDKIDQNRAAQGGP